MQPQSRWKRSANDARWRGDRHACPIPTRSELKVGHSRAHDTAQKKADRFRSSWEGPMCEICRRSFIRGAAALGAAGATGISVSPLLAQARRDAAGGAHLPARREFTLANGYVLALAGSLGDTAGGAGR